MIIVVGHVHCPSHMLSATDSYSGSWQSYYRRRRTMY
ncbi:hypothetical protein WG66_010932 [Moniliophthora roreri]|nr:hypothetical protein WG66_010932 [Moniliophthora roreri]